MGLTFTVNYTALISKIWEDGNIFCYFRTQIISEAIDGCDVLDLKELTQKVSVSGLFAQDEWSPQHKLSILPRRRLQSFSGWDNCNKLMKIWK